MKLPALLCAFLTAALTSTAATSPNREGGNWPALAAPADIGFSSLAVHPSGSVYAAGYFRPRPQAFVYGATTLNILGGTGEEGLVTLTSWNGQPERAFLFRNGADHPVRVHSLAIHPVTGDTYVMGTAVRGVDITDGTTTLSLPGANPPATTIGLFVAKFSGGSNLVWAFKIGGTDGAAQVGTDLNAAKTIALDAAGNVYITGRITSGVTIRGAFGASKVRNDLSDQAGFLAKFRPDGSLDWANMFDGGNGNDYASGLAVDRDGTAFVTGRIALGNSMTFEDTASPTALTLTVAEPTKRLFVAAYNPAGRALRGWLFGSDNDTEARAIIADDTKVVVSGRFRGNFGLAATSDNASYDSFVVAFDKQGTPLWGNGIGNGSGGQNEIVDLAIDDRGDVLFVGAADNGEVRESGGLNVPTSGGVQAPFFYGFQAGYLGKLTGATGRGQWIEAIGAGQPASSQANALALGVAGQIRLAVASSGDVQWKNATVATLGTGGSIIHAVDEGPRNDAFTNRLTLTGTVAQAVVVNRLATREPGEPDHAGVTGGNAGLGSVWWRWVAPTNGLVTLDTVGSLQDPATPLDTLLAVYTGTALNALVPVAGNDDAAVGTLTSRLTFIATANQEYQIAADGKGGRVGQIRLNLQQANANPSAQTISFGPLGNKTFGDAPFTVNATASSGLPVSFSVFAGPATLSGNIISLTGTGTVVVRASQAGDANYSAAPNVDQSFTVGSVSLQFFTDNFDDNIKDGVKWGTDFNPSGNSGGVIAETNQRLEFTLTGGTGTTRVRPWVQQNPTYVQDWEAILDVADALVFPSSSPGVSIGLAVQNATNAAHNLTVELYSDNTGSAAEGFYSELNNLTGGGPFSLGEADTDDLNVSQGKVRLTFDSATKVIRAYYRTTGNWVLLASYGLAGSGGTTGNGNWGMGGSAEFQIGIYGYSGGATIAAGQVTADNFQLALGTLDSSIGVLPTIDIPPANQTVFVGDTVQFSVTATGTAPLTYQWFRGSTPVLNATNATLTLPNVQPGQAGNYQVIITNFVGAVTSASPAVLTVLTTNGVIGPASGLADRFYDDGFVRVDGSGSAGGYTAFWGYASASQVTSAGQGSLTFHWTNIVGNQLTVVTDVYSLGGVFPPPAPFAGTFFNMPGAPLLLAGSLTRTVTVVTLAPPSIATPPQPVSVSQGQPAQFNVTASGTPAPVLQWLKNGTPIPGQTSATLAFASAQPSDVGFYSVAVTNIAGGITSAPVQLTVGVLPTIDTPPVHQTLTNGALTLNVTASGPGPLTYQWRRNGVDIPGATSATFTLPAPTTADAGRYTVVVGNAAGTRESVAADVEFFGDLKFYSGTIIAGPVGKRYRVEYTEDLGATPVWQTLQEVTLPFSPYLLIDTASPGRGKRFYRSIPLP